MERNEKLIRMKLWQYLLPSIMMTAALQMGNIVDTMLVGNILGADAMSAVKVGMRHGVPCVLKVDTGRMVKDGYTFYLSENGVWLVEKVPAEYLERVAEA